MQSTKLIQVKVIALLEEKLSHSPVVLLLDKEKNRILPIWIGEPEARAIVISLHKIDTARPVTHQLLNQTIKQLNATIEKIVIDKIEINTFYATIHLIQYNKSVLIDARPSDAIALSLESETPLFVAENIMLSASQENPLGASIMQEIEKEQGSANQLEKTAGQPKLSSQEIEKLKKLLEEARQHELEN